MNKFSRYPKSAQIAIIVGAACILFGVWRLFGVAFGYGWWNALQRMVGTVFSYLWPIALICAGLYLVWAAKSGRLKGVTNIDWRKPFGRSVTDKRIAGVCGGIAQFLGIDSTIVRVLVVILFVISPAFTVLAYIVAAIFIPRL